jgi:Spy/CpxP family protein refolding chaperone
MMRHVFERLETSPGQEKVILDAMDGVRTTGEKFRGELGNTRQEISRALRGEHFDAAALRELFAKHDALVAELRESAMAGLSQVHEALDDRQRRELSEWVEDAGRFGFGRWA